MKNKILKMFSLLILAVIAIPVYANTVSQVWTCQLRDGKTGADARAVSAAWLQVARGMKGGDGLEVYVLSPLVADTSADHFLFVLNAPSIEQWGVFNGGYENSPAAKADEDFDQVASCSRNSLWESVQVE